MFDYTLIRSERKTLGIEIDRSGRLIVRAPLKMRQAEIERFLQTKEPWIKEKQAVMLMRQRVVMPANSNVLWYFGRQFALTHADCKTLSFLIMQSLYQTIGMKMISSVGTDRSCAVI